MLFPPDFSFVDIAQSKRVLLLSDTAAAVAASWPPIDPGFGAESGMVKTIGSGIGGAPATGRAGVMLEF